MFETKKSIGKTIADYWHVDQLITNDGILF